MADLSLRFVGNNHIRFADAIEALGNATLARRAFAAGLNHTGAKARTQVVRALSKQVGLTQAKVRRLGGIKATRANPQRLGYSIGSTGRHIELKEFSARQFSFGVRAKPWGRSQRFESAFIFAGTPRSGQPIAGGSVFRRTSGESFPIQRLFGPAIPNELVKDESARAFEDASLELGPRIAHEVRRLTRGVVS
jgi:hypothetical protein